MAAYCDMALLFFIENEPPLPEVTTPGFRFFLLWMIPTLFQLYSNYSEFPNTCEVIVRFCQVVVRLTVQNCPGTVQLFQTLMYQGLNYQIIDVIQPNRAKFIFNRAEKKKPNICEDVRPFPTSKRTTIK